MIRPALALALASGLAWPGLVAAEPKSPPVAAATQSAAEEDESPLVEETGALLLFAAHQAVVRLEGGHVTLVNHFVSEVRSPPLPPEESVRFALHTDDTGEHTLIAQSERTLPLRFSLALIVPRGGVVDRVVASDCVITPGQLLILPLQADLVAIVVEDMHDAPPPPGAFGGCAPHSRRTET